MMHIRMKTFRLTYMLMSWEWLEDGKADMSPQVPTQKTLIH